MKNEILDKINIILFKMMTLASFKYSYYHEMQLKEYTDTIREQLILNRNVLNIDEIKRIRKDTNSMIDIFSYKWNKRLSSLAV